VKISLRMLISILVIFTFFLNLVLSFNIFNASAATTISVTNTSPNNPGYIWCQKSNGDWTTYSSNDGNVTAINDGGEPKETKVYTSASIQAPTTLWSDSNGNTYTSSQVINPKPVSAVAQGGNTADRSAEVDILTNTVLINGKSGKGWPFLPGGNACGGNNSVNYVFPITVSWEGQIEVAAPPKGTLYISYFTESGASLSGVFPSEIKTMEIGSPQSFSIKSHVDYTYSGYKKSSVAQPSGGSISNGTPPSFNYDGSHPKYWVYYYYKEKPGVDIPEPEPDPEPNPTPVNHPPSVTISAASRITMGSDTDITISSSISSMGNVNGSFNQSGESTVWFSSPGTYTVSATVSDGRATSNTSHSIIVDPVYPAARLSKSGKEKVNKKISLDASLSDGGSSRYPLDWNKTKWILTPVSGITAEDIKTNSSLNGTKVVDLLFKKQGIIDVQVTITNTAGYSSSTVNRLNIGPDLPPVADFSVAKTLLRDPENNNKATFTPLDTSISPDGDNIGKRLWFYARDTNNNGDFNGETAYVFDNGAWRSTGLTLTEVYAGGIDPYSIHDGNRATVDFVTGQVGQIKSELMVCDDMSDSIPEFISNSDIPCHTTYPSKPAIEKISDVGNAAPNVLLTAQTQNNKKVDMAVVTDYTGAKLSQLNTDLSLLKADLYTKHVDLKYTILTDKVKVGEQTRTTTKHYYARYIDFYYTQNNLSGDGAPATFTNYTPVQYETAAINEELGDVLPAFQKRDVIAHDQSGQLSTQGSNFAYIWYTHSFYDPQNYGGTKVSVDLGEQMSTSTGYYYARSFSNFSWSLRNAWAITPTTTPVYTQYDVNALDMSKVSSLSYRSGAEKILFIAADSVGTEYWGNATNDYSFGGLNDKIINYVTANNMAVFSYVPDSILDFKYNNKQYATNINTQKLSIRELVKSSPRRGKILNGNWQEALDYLKFNQLNLIKKISIDNNTVTIDLDESFQYGDEAFLHYIQEQVKLQDEVGNEIPSFMDLTLTNMTGVTQSGTLELKNGLVFIDAFMPTNNGKTVIRLGAPSSVGGTYRYKIGATFATVGETLDSSWITTTNLSMIATTNNTDIGVAEVNPSGKVVQFSRGKAVVINE
jgi:hypothetical protein